ncbi:MAG: DUF547 domain-containing protein, partial [Gammaproteobacteria bacterium]|nr:DUF547 domain-containing protein [Gammaproteobacteria bacterium]
ELLDAGMKAYLNHTRALSVMDGKLTISSIFDWYMEDFGQDSEEVIAFLMRHLQPDLSEQLGAFSKFETTYDWEINSP